jgi:hypothetical protein
MIIAAASLASQRRQVAGLPRPARSMLLCFVKRLGGIYLHHF